jgi:hypothetical protein
LGLILEGGNDTCELLGAGAFDALTVVVPRGVRRARLYVKSAAIPCLLPGGSFLCLLRGQKERGFAIDASCSGGQCEAGGIGLRDATRANGESGGGDGSE